MIQHRNCTTRTTHNFIRRALGNWQGKRACLSFFSRLAIVIGLGAAMMSCPSGAFAQEGGPVARWSFDNTTGPVVRDAASGTEDKVEGFYQYVAGVSGNGLRFDGYTTGVVRKAENAPKLHGSFSVEGWIALDTYPWNWVPVVDQEKDQQSGYFFGVDALGHVGLQVDVDGIWYSVTSTDQIPLKKWAQITGTYEENRGLAIYLDGREVGRLDVRGALLPAEMQDLVIGRVREPLPPFPSFAINPWYPVWYSLDGILDEVAIYDRSLSGEEVQRTYVSAHAPRRGSYPLAGASLGPSRSRSFRRLLLHPEVRGHLGQAPAHWPGFRCGGSLR